MWFRLLEQCEHLSFIVVGTLAVAISVLSMTSGMMGDSCSVGIGTRSHYKQISRHFQPSVPHREDRR